MDFAAVLQDALRASLGPLAAAYALAAIGLNLHFGCLLYTSDAADE